MPEMQSIRIADRTTPRDFFAGCAMAGLLAAMKTPADGEAPVGWEEVCKDAYTGANCMMKERSRQRGE